jgi:hypothetical protein
VTLPKPPELHDRERQWGALADFATGTDLGARLSVVYGRRRQGKTMMLDLLARSTGGLIFTGLPQGGPLNLRRFARAFAEYTGGPVPAFDSWEDGVDFLLRLGERRTEPTVLVLDEFPYLMTAEPALPSILQIALEPGGRARAQGRARLVLCGSALHVMRGLLAGSAPLRGRADYELVVAPFEYRDAAAFWGLADDADLAFRVHALLGGTPAYRAMSGGPPSDDALFDEWVVGGPLNPDRAMFREGAALLNEDPSFTDLGLYHSVLAAIAQGAGRRSEIAGLLGRPDSALTHPLSVLEQTQLVERVEDALRARRPVYRIAEPELRLHQLIIAPNEADLVGGLGVRVWQDVQDTVRSKIYGPHLEDLARQWCRMHAGTSTLGGRPSSVRSATVACPQHRHGHELDVVVRRSRPGEPDAVLAIGEVKATAAPVGQAQLDRLAHLRELLPTASYQTLPRLLLFSRNGFTPDLRHTAATRSDLELVDLDRLYRGD